eukprot:TRINITY_DN380_c0_g1_i1.p1 TRINITY_DN380_c0_g1~~TRINITY_DN380_c0_g1_i1.p1  ORF type:complete len:198 (+),score=57.74 TRINITY_DN380_c0_g1_i1:701-1294(+)
MKNETVIVVKAPSGTILAVSAETQEVKKHYQFHLKNNESKPIFVYLLTKENEHSHPPPAELSEEPSPSPSTSTTSQLSSTLQSQSLSNPIPSNPSLGSPSSLPLSSTSSTATSTSPSSFVCPTSPMRGSHTPLIMAAGSVMGGGGAVVNGSGGDGVDLSLYVNQHEHELPSSYADEFQEEFSADYYPPEAIANFYNE